ncbi:MAG: alginate O-acetyltransferase complex protein AlgI [Arcticibacterium sp.]
MAFNSVDFALFLPLVFGLYWFVFKSLRAQNVLLLISSYLFYGWWDWRFLGLIIFSSLIDYVIGLELEKLREDSKRRALLFTSLFVNLGFLAVFKYFNFFLENFAEAFTFFGGHLEVSRLNIILPVGISFYTFQTLSYSIDVYRRKIEPTRDVISFLSFVSFFPQLVAGPIERASNLLPQFHSPRNFNYSQAVEGMRQILWGLLKKIVIADNCAEIVNLVFDNPSSYSGSTLVLGVIFFAFQIYGDFSGYSDIAIGTSRLFGFDLMKNFAYPYFSRDIGEFWRRWHISLSTWFRDYLYIPLGGSKGSMKIKVRNVFLIFLVSGFWHGANWTFLIWGALNAIYFLPLLLMKKNRRYLEVPSNDKLLPSVREVIQMLITFSLVSFSWIFFRADSLPDAVSYINSMFSLSVFSIPTLVPKTLVLLLFAFVLTEWLQRKEDFALGNLQRKLAKPLRWLSYVSLIFVIYFFGNYKESVEFIYFQF